MNKQQRQSVNKAIERLEETICNLISSSGVDAVERKHLQHRAVDARKELHKLLDECTH